MGSVPVLPGAPCGRREEIEAVGQSELYAAMAPSQLVKPRGREAEHFKIEVTSYR